MRLSIFFLVCFMLPISSILGQSTTPVGGGGGGGGGAGDPTCSLSVAPSPDILIGKNAEFTATAAGGTPDYTYGIVVTCTPAMGGAIPAIAGGEESNKLNWCAGKIGSHTGYAQATDSAGKTSNVATATINVLAPNKLVICAGDKTVAFTGNSANCVHTFVLKRDDEDVGGCLVANCAERAWDEDDDEPTEWQFTGTTPTNTPQFYFSSPKIHDTRYYTKGAAYLAADPGEVVFETCQRVKVDVPKCPSGTVAIESAVLVYKIIKVDNNNVRMVVTKK